MLESTDTSLPKEPRRLAVVDDHAIMRGVFLTLVEDASDELTMAWMASSITDARSKMEKDVPDFLVMDVELPDGNGFEFIQEVLKKQPKLPVLMVSAQGDKSYPKKALACGAKGFIGKATSLELLVEAVSAIQQGGRWFLGMDENRASGTP